ncbi:hypothetical protein SAMN05660657_02954 [Geodermatophilus amargosae]|uniref:Uncharacterized protein n=1 Tax=Geodermatophilus amargosae TaxID=1296565 RepID=A0A1I7AQC4_9ACTN|nr:hypothetical protein [Geodermatophilus amargosae]SFT77063.1 hypothetical protein SAMN05660657_02954 [Geodermatophilus amargosae]
MLIDCDSCTARGVGCADCVVTALLGAPPGERDTTPVLLPVPPVPAARTADVAVPRPGVVVELDDVERRAVRALAEGGLVPPLRHRPSGDGRRRTG